MNDKLKNKLKENFDVALEGGTSLLGGLLSDALIGQVAPGVVTTYLSYKQKRSEKMLLKTIDEIRNQMVIFESGLKELTTDQMEFIKGEALPFILDNIIEEEQEAKIELIINGFKTIINHKITDDDLIITYYDILKKLRMIDIEILLDIYHKNNIPKGVDGVVQTSNKLSEEEIVNVKITDATRNHSLRKLKLSSLLSIAETWIDASGDESIIEDDRLSISVLGNAFIDFFANKGDY